MTIPTRQDDALLLKMLDMRADGLSMGEIGRRVGKTKSAVIGAISRVWKDADPIACKCRKKANQDGGMPRRWWQ